MPSQYDMSEGDDLYRGILEWEHQPMVDVPNPDYDPQYAYGNGKMYDHTKQPWSKTIKVPRGPTVWKERMIGPYKDTRPIKAYVTRNRGRYQGHNLRIKRVERVSAWEEVTNY